MIDRNDYSPLIKAHQSFFPFKAVVLLLFFLVIVSSSYRLIFFESVPPQTTTPLPITTSRPIKVQPQCIRNNTFSYNRNAKMDYLMASHHLENTPFPKEQIVPAFQYYQENYNIAPKYNLATCNIPKILATIKNALFWLLYDTNSYFQGNYSLNTVDWDTLFKHLDSARYQLQDLRKELQPGYLIFTVHREPTTRFISGYVDKCINNNSCYHCKKNVTCFAEELYRRLMLFGNGFQLDMDYGMEDFHFNPQTWFCRFNDTFYDYRMIKYESGEDTKQMVDEILDVLRRSCVEENLLKLIEKQLMEGETFHTTRGSLVRTSLEEEIYSNPVLINLLIKIYYYDYIVFNYPLPIVPKR